MGTRQRKEEEEKDCGRKRESISRHTRKIQGGRERGRTIHRKGRVKSSHRER